MAKNNKNEKNLLKLQIKFFCNNKVRVSGKIWIYFECLAKVHLLHFIFNINYKYIFQFSHLKLFPFCNRFIFCCCLLLYFAIPQFTSKSNMYLYLMYVYVLQNIPPSQNFECKMEKSLQFIVVNSNMVQQWRVFLFFFFLLC